MNSGSLSPSRVQTRRAEARRRIGLAARDVIAEVGFSAATIRAVAEHADVAVGTVYTHFPSKGELFADVVSRIARFVLDEVERIIARPGSVEARLAQAIEAVAAVSLAEPRLAWALIAEPADPLVDAERLRYRSRSVDLVAGLLDAGVASRDIPPQNTSLSATAIVGVVGEVLTRPLAPGDVRSPDREAVVDDLIAFCLRGVSAEPARPTRGPAAPSGGADSVGPTP